MHIPHCADCCPTGNKVVFQIPSDSCEQGHKQRAHFKFTSDGVGDLAREEPGQLKLSTAEDYQGVVYDFPKQVIKMKIGRTIEMPGRKSKLEYQFVTPVFTQEKVVPVRDTRTAQCVNTCPNCCARNTRCILPTLPYYQELTNEQKINIKTWRSLKTNISKTSSYLSRNSDVNCWKIINRHYPLPLNLNRDKSILSDSISNTTRSTEKSNNCSTSICNEENVWESYISVKSLPITIAKMYSTGLYGSKATPVYMLSDNLSRRRSSATQATASINKCFQVCGKWPKNAPSNLASPSDFRSTCTISTFSSTQNHRSIPENVRYPRVYFFGRSKEEKKPKGMGPKGSKVRLQKTSQTSSTGIRSSGSKSSIRTTSNTNVNNSNSTNTISKPRTTLPPRSSKTAATSVGNSKTVSIKDDRSQKPCPSIGTTKGDMTVTVSHIRIGPKETCPVHGSEPCQGPKCILASSGAEQGPVKVTSINNPRRGVFEVVIRRLTGAPLAKNELMLEWTPPPSRAPPCGVPCPTTCFPPSPYRSSKCKLIVCRPSPCRPKCSKKKRCGRSPCGPAPCRKCKTSCCGKSCSSCKSCPPPSCTPCSRCIPKCGPPCSPAPCGKPPCNPCKSSPCLRPCPIGYKRPRRSRSQPRIKCHRKRISPCNNKSKTCPVVRCRSVSGPCIACCNIPPFCLPRKCCSVLPCKPPKCISSCSSCCG